MKRVKFEIVSEEANSEAPAQEDIPPQTQNEGFQTTLKQELFLREKEVVPELQDHQNNNHHNSSPRPMEHEGEEEEEEGSEFVAPTRAPRRNGGRNKRATKNKRRNPNPSWKAKNGNDSIFTSIVDLNDPSLFGTLVTIDQPSDVQRELLIPIITTLEQQLIQTRKEQLRILHALERKKRLEKDFEEQMSLEKMYKRYGFDFFAAFEEKHSMENLHEKHKQLLTAIYKCINKRTDLYFSVDKDIRSFGSKERVTRSRTEDTRAKEEGSKTALISSGYGEIRQGSFKHLMEGFLTGVPEKYRPVRGSTFLDIGSGFGKCIFHAALEFPFVRTVGIEIVKNRYLLSNEVLTDFMVSVPELAKRELNLESIEFLWGDITQWDPIEVSEFTHLYSFDPVFSVETLRSLIQLLEVSEWQIWATCCPEHKLRKLGGENFVLVHRVSGAQTTGGESFSFYYYAKKRPDYQPKSSEASTKAELV